MVASPGPSADSHPAATSVVVSVLVADNDPSGSALADTRARARLRKKQKRMQAKTCLATLKGEFQSMPQRLITIAGEKGLWSIILVHGGYLV